MTEERYQGKRPRGRKRKFILEDQKAGKSYHDMKRRAKDGVVKRGVKSMDTKKVVSSAHFPFARFPFSL